MSSQLFAIKTTDNLSLYAEYWLPDQRPPKAAIAMIHGIGEYGGRYERLALDFVQKQIAFFVFDQRGHGRSDGKRGHTPSLQAWLDDMHRFLAEVQLIVPNCPIILYGQSMGGVEVLNYILQTPDQITAAIASSPAIEPAFPVPSWKIWAGKLANVLFPSLALSSGLPLEYLSHDPMVAPTYKSDPFNHDQVSARTFSAINKAGKFAVNNATTLKIPLLVMHGTDDHITSPIASESFANKAGSLCVLKLWNGFYHELHNEDQRFQVMKFVEDWIASCIDKDTKPAVQL